MFQHHQIIKYVDFTGGLDTNKHQTTWITWQGFFPPDNTPLKSTFAITFAPPNHSTTSIHPLKPASPAMVSPEITIDISILSIYAKPHHPLPPCWIPISASFGSPGFWNQINHTQSKGIFRPDAKNLSERNWPNGWFPKIVVPPKSSMLIGFALINHPFWGTIIFGNTQMGDGWNEWNLWRK